MNMQSRKMLFPAIPSMECTTTQQANCNKKSNGIKTKIYALIN
jgi:hypothetical protein